MLPLHDRLPTRSVPVVNYLLLASNVVAFMLAQTLIASGVPPRQLVMAWGLVPERFVEAPIADSLTVLSSMFLHDPTGWLHLGGNMLFLWIFGDNVEDALGRVRYLLFYLACGVGAALAQVLIDPSSRIPMVGASGAISGVLAAYGSLYPMSRITVVNPIPLLWFVFGLLLDIPAWLVILEYFVVNLWSGLGSLGAHGGGVAFFAHIGGFVAGMLLVRAMMIGREPREHERWKTWRPSRPPPRSRTLRPRGPRGGGWRGW